MVMSNRLIAKNMTREEISGLLDVVQACTDCATKEDLQVAVESLKSLVPFKFFTCVYARMRGGTVCDPYHIINVNYPEEWVNIYMERKYHLVDPIVKENFSKFTLQYWADTYRAKGADKEFLSCAEDFGLCSGYTSGIRNLSGDVGGLFSFAGEDIERSERVGAVIEVITPHLFNALERIIGTEKLKSAPPLSGREREVLKWIAYGKTTWETSAILGISERTVKFHVNNIMKKMNAVSRTHAVAIASELGLVDLE